MINAKKFYWLAQVLGWTAYCGLILLSVYTKTPEILTGIFLLNILFVIFIGIAVTHVQRIMFIKMGWLELRLPKLLPRLIASSILSAVLIIALDLMTDYFSGLAGGQGPPIEFSRLIVSVLLALLLVVAWNAIYFTFHFFQKSRNQEISNLELAASNKESELKNLRSQLNPHFLFNSLNSIRALVDLDPVKAKMSITTLSNLLRQSLVLGKENLVDLTSELALAKSYLDLEKIRFEERLNVDWEIDNELENFEIPPFSMQMMVENAIKHGISNLKDGGVVKVKAYREEDVVFLEVINSGDLKDVVDLGVGIQNIKQRLALQYGDAASFNIKEVDGYVYAKMSFKNEGI
ncbi:MAG: sensor histidine kinase YesM [Crocinitomicaceae bacterium]